MNRMRTGPAASWSRRSDPPAADHWRTTCRRRRDIPILLILPYITLYLLIRKRISVAKRQEKQNKTTKKKEICFSIIPSLFLFFVSLLFHNCLLNTTQQKKEIYIHIYIDFWSSCVFILFCFVFFSYIYRYLHENVIICVNNLIL